MKWSLLLLLHIFLFCQALFASTYDSSAKGTSSANFLKLGIDARTTSMGDAHSAAIEDASTLYWNPAAMTNIQKPCLLLTHASYVETSYFDYGAYVQPIGVSKAIGLGVQYVSAGEITKTDDSGNTIGSFSPNDLAATFGYANRFNLVSFGIVGKFVRSTIIDTAQTYSMDAGVLVGPLLNKINFSLVASNLVGKLKYEKTKQNLPTMLKVGASYKPFDRWSVSGDMVFSRDSHPYFSLGTEYGILALKSFRLNGRIGYNSHDQQDIKNASGLRVGFGFQLPTFSVDYAFIPYGELGTTHRMTFNIFFGRESPYSKSK